MRRLMRKIELGIPEIQKYEESGLLGPRSAWWPTARRRARPSGHSHGSRPGIQVDSSGHELWRSPRTRCGPRGAREAHHCPEMNLGQLVLEVERSWRAGAPCTG